MALFQEETTTQEEFNKQHGLSQEQSDVFSNLGYDDIIQKREEIRQKRINEENNWVKNIISPDKVNEWKSKGSMTAIEVFNRKQKNELIPYMGTFKQGSKSFDIKNISDKIQSGQTITPQERERFENFVLDLAEIQTRGYSFGGGVANIGLETIPFMAEFALGLLTSGGVGSIGSVGSKITEQVVKKSLTKKIFEGIGKTAYNATLNPRTYAFTATRLSQQVRARYGDIMLSDSLAISPEGQTILKESQEKPAIAFMKALGLTNIEVASEMSGEMLVRPILQAGGKLGKVIAKPILKILPKGFSDNFVKLAEDTTKLPFLKAVDKLGWNGVLEEMGEERIGDLLQFAFNLDGEDGYSFEQLLDALFPSVEQLGQEALSFGLTGLGMNALHKGIKSIPVVSDKYSKDDFLLDTGIFRAHGYDSYLDKKVKEQLATKGKTDEEIDNALDFSTREDKIQFLKDTKTEFNSKKEYDAKGFEKELKAQEIEDKTYTKFLQGGVSQDVAFAHSKLFGQFFKRFGADDIQAFDKWFNKFDVQYNVPAENKIEQFQSNEKIYDTFIEKHQKQNLIDKLPEYWNGETIEDAKKYLNFKNGKVELQSPIEKIKIYEQHLKHLIEENNSYRKKYLNRVLKTISTPNLIVKNGQYNNYIKLFVGNNNKIKPHLQIVKVKNDGSFYVTTMKPSKSQVKKLILEGQVIHDLSSMSDTKSIDNNIINDNAENFNPKTYYQSDILKTVNILKDILSKKDKEKVTEIFDSVTLLKPLKNYFSDVLDDVYFQKMPKWMAEREDSAGGYLEFFNKTVYLNYDKIDSYPNKGQQFIRVLLHELMHAKLENAIRYADKNLNNKELSEEDKQELQEFLNAINVSKEDIKKYKDFTKKHNVKDVKKDYELVKQYKKAYSYYNNSAIETEVDNVALALQSLLGNSSNRKIRYFGLRAFFNMDLRKESQRGRSELQYIKGFNERYNTLHYGYGRLSNSVNTKTYYQSVYHGTPHKFDEFSLDAIGTGEGAQAHGWGLYFADNKDVSEGYRKSLSNDDFDNEKYFYNGKEITDRNKKAILSTIVDNGKDKVISMREKNIEKYKYSQEEYKQKNEELDWIKSLDENKIEKKTDKGQLFEVDIPEDDVLLDEDKELIHQPDKVQRAIEKIYADAMKSNNVELTNAIGITGKEIYRGFSKYFGSDKKASEFLNSYGIKGITYDGRQDGRCYVIFDDKAVNVLKTYYQEANSSDNEKLIAGYTYQEVIDKLTEIYDKIGNMDERTQKGEVDKLLAESHILEDAFEIAEGNDPFHNEEKNHEIMLNAYYVMNNQEIPEKYTETDSISQRTYKDLLDIHNRKKEEAEKNYYGYFTEGNDKNIITIMSDSNASTALHELGHLFLNGLNELANSSKEAKKQLDAVNKWLGFSGEYTVAQQEKFARSFEAYLYKGKAPNNYLRHVFENFKEWLKSVYHHLTDLEDRGADISKEVQELFDNMFSSDEYYQERKEATKLLSRVKLIAQKDKLEKLPVRNDKSLSEGEKKCKNVCYDILSSATGKDKNYLKRIFETDSNKNGYAKRREIVEELIEKADDKITISGGMKEEWREFFADTGVSYDNDEVGGDYKLAEKALWTIINKDYWDSSTFERDLNNRLDSEAMYFEKAIDDADRQYETLIREFKKGNRNVALSAVYEWLDSLPEQIKQDYEDKFIFDSGIIERNENIDKFDKAKRQILSKAMSLENKYSIDKDEQYKEVVKEIIKSLNFLQPLDKAKLTANILDVSSTEFLMSSIDNILDIAKTMEDVNLRRKLEIEIHKELQGTKNIKKNGRTIGKYDYRTNKIFEELRELDRLTPEKANELRLETSKFIAAEDNGLSKKDKLINKFLSYKAGGRTFADTELMKELYDEITKIKLVGKSAKSELDLMEKLDEKKDIEELIKLVEEKKEAGFIVKNYIDKLANLESILNAIFNKDIKEKYGAEILYAETQSQAWQHEQKQKFEKEVAKIYNLPQWCWDKKIIEYLAEKHTYSEIRRKYDTHGNIIKLRNIDRTLTKMDIIQAYIWSKNEILEKRLKNQFGEETLESMFELLSKEDEKLAETLMNTAQSFYPIVNKAFINKYGLDLPKVSCYFPSTPERGSEVDLYNDYSSKTLGNSFTKTRAQSETQAMDFHNPVTTLYSHIEGVAKFAFMSASLDKANLRFKDLNLKRVIINKYGEDAYRSLEQALINITYKKEAPVFNGLNKIIDNMVGNWIQANVAIKPIVGLKQLLSANNYAVDMPYMTWQKGFLEALADFKGTIDYMMNIPYIKARYEGSYSNEFLKQTIENSAFATSKKLKDCCNLFIKIGDIGAIMFGGKPYIDYLIKEKGLSEEEAIKQFILSTNRSQQSSAISSLSNFQIAMTRNSFGKLFIAFKNSPQQYVRKCADAIISVANGDMTKEQCAKELFQYAYLQPFLYAIATSGSLFRFLFTGDDDDLIKDAKLSIFNLNANAIPLLGDIYQYAINRLAFKEGGMPQVTPLQGDIQREISRISKEDADLTDYLTAIGYIFGHVGLGYNTKAITTMGSGVGDIIDGNIAQGSMKVLGYTDKRAQNILKK